MEIYWKAETHPNMLLQRVGTSIKDWLNKIVCTTDATLEIPINANIFYPVDISPDPKLKGITNYMLLRAAFNFYFETEVEPNFLKCAQLEFKEENNIWFDYLDANFRVIQTIKKLDEDEFMIVCYHRTYYSPPQPLSLIEREKQDKELSVLCKSCYWMNVLEEEYATKFYNGTHKCERCKAVLIDIIKNGVY
jgi:hypothetical protein